VPGQIPEILTVARLAPQKGLEQLVEAAARLHTRPVKWLVAGEGPLRGQLEQQIKSTGAPVVLLGRRDDLANRLRQADLVVSTAHWEGQPIGLQEAIKAGAAILATDVGGTAETLGQAGQLVAANPQAIAQAVDQLLGNPTALAELRHRAQQQAKLLPTQTDLLAQVERVYRSPSTD
jgi:glycosyltransferase involved in cell wall biosynthesis